MLTPLYLPSFSLEHRQKICVTFEPRNAAPMEQHPKIRKLCEEDVAGQCLRFATAKLLGILGTIMGNAVKTILHHTIFFFFYHLFMVIWRIVYDCLGNQWENTNPW